MKNNYIKHDGIKILLVYNIVILILAISFYKIIPWILNYPPESINTEFEKTIDQGFYYYQQYIAIMIFVIIISNLVIWLQIKDINKWYILFNQEDNKNIDKLLKIKKKCFYLPQTIYLQQIFSLLIFITLILFITGAGILLIIKIDILIFVFTTFLGLVSYIYSKRIFKKILWGTKNIEMYESRIKLNFRSKTFMQVLPLFLVSVLFSSMVGYSQIIKEKGNLIFDQYKIILDGNFSNSPMNISENEIKAKLLNIKLKQANDIVFIINPERKVILNENNLSNFFINYTCQVSSKYNGHTYDYYGTDTQGSVKNISTDRGQYIIGIKFVVNSNATMISLFLSIFIMLILCIIFLIFFSKDISDDLSNVSTALSKMAEGESVDNDEKITVTSNDEIGELVFAFNKIQELERKNLKEIKENQAILMERERLASLGQLIGGIAHNLKTPIMSISGGILGLNELVKEFKISLEDSRVTKKDYLEITNEMTEWLEKMKPYCSYMSDVITAVKGQAVQMNDSTTTKFTISELIKRVELLMRHELKKYHCTLNIKSNIEMDSEIMGEINNLIQVFDNIIINSIQAYEGKVGSIDLNIELNGENVEFTFTDYAKGMPQDVSNKLFKEMITTKGKNGTGLGLYMSYSTIKGRFSGKMSFTSKEDCGTIFNISIPCVRIAVRRR